jgi:hypothetical protein
MEMCAFQKAKFGLLSASVLVGRSRVSLKYAFKGRKITTRVDLRVVGLALSARDIAMLFTHMQTWLRDKPTSKSGI